MGRYGEAEPLYQRALAIYEEQLGPDHPDTATNLNNLASLYDSMGRYGEAEPLYQRALAIGEAQLGPDHPSTAISLNNLAELYDSMGRYGEAEPLYQRALAIREAQLGPDHPSTATSLNNLAVLYWGQGDQALSLTYFQKGLAAEEQILNRNLIGGSEANKWDYLKTFIGTTDEALTFALQDPTSYPAAQLALTTVLQRKGRLLDLFTNSQQILRDQLDPESQLLLDKLNNARSQLAALTFNRSESLPLDLYRQQLSTLNQDIAELENDLSRLSAEFRATNQPIDLASIQRLLPSDSALIEYVRYRPFDPTAPQNQQNGEDHYAVYILNPNGDIQGVDLGAAADIDALIADFTVVLQNPSTSPQEVQEAAQALQQAIWAPLNGALVEVEHLLISPDSALNLIPFEALVDETGQYLVNQYTTTYLTSGRDLLRLQEPSTPQQPPLLVANPAFNRPGEVVELAQGPTERYTDLKQATFSPLPETEDEAREIQRGLPQAQLLRGPQATEFAVKQTQRPSILHIATHGFFVSADPNEAVPTDNPVVPRDNPLLRSGLVLSGFRTGEGGGTEDGILSALEVASLNLFGTQLVVLSACDTGQGDTTVGEGVYGLRRALVLAGSRSQVISLWRVQSDTTTDLMVAYYDRLTQGEGRSEALRNTRLAMLQDPATAHPYYWAPFIQSGDWQPLDLDRL